MHVVRVVSRQRGREYTSFLLRNSYREGGKVRKQTLANLSHLPEPMIELIRGCLRGEHYLAAGDAVSIVRSSPHGHVAAVLGVVRSLGLEGAPRSAAVARAEPGAGHGRSSPPRPLLQARHGAQPRTEHPGVDPRRRRRDGGRAVWRARLAARPPGQGRARPRGPPSWLVQPRPR